MCRGPERDVNIGKQHSKLQPDVEVKPTGTVGSESFTEDRHWMQPCGLRQGWKDKAGSWPVPEVPLCPARERPEHFPNGPLWRINTALLGGLPYIIQ